MMERMKRDAVIEAMMTCVNGGCDRCRYNTEEPLRPFQPWGEQVKICHREQLMRDALDLMVPRLMRDDELRCWAMAPYTEREPIWIEWQTGEGGYYRSGRLRESCLTGMARAWTSEPTLAMRRAEPWRKKG